MGHETKLRMVGPKLFSVVSVNGIEFYVDGQIAGRYTISVVAELCCDLAFYIPRVLLGAPAKYL